MSADQAGSVQSLFPPHLKGGHPGIVQDVKLGYLCSPYPEPRGTEQRKQTRKANEIACSTHSLTYLTTGPITNHTAQTITRLHHWLLSHGFDIGDICNIYYGDGASVAICCTNPYIAADMRATLMSPDHVYEVGGILHNDFAQWSIENTGRAVTRT